MSEPITIRLEGPPRGKGRHRSRITNVPGRKPFVQTYSDRKTEVYERGLAQVARVEMMGRALLTGPVVVVVYAFFPIPVSWTKAKKREARNHILRPVTKPDWDNLGKVCDALNGVVWGDDAAVVDGSVRKFYSDDPELVVTVEPWVPALPAAVAMSEAA